MSKLIITTDNRWKKFKYAYEVPKSVLKSQFDYLLDKETGEPDGDQGGDDGYFKFYKTWYHTSEFTRTGGYGGDIAKWDGIKNESFSTGVLLKMSSDGEEYKVASYRTVSGD